MEEAKRCTFFSLFSFFSPMWSEISLLPGMSMRSQKRISWCQATVRPGEGARSLNPISMDYWHFRYKKSCIRNQVHCGEWLDSIDEPSAPKHLNVTFSRFSSNDDCKYGQCRIRVTWFKTSLRYFVNRSSKWSSDYEGLCHVPMCAYIACHIHMHVGSVRFLK